MKKKNMRRKYLIEKGFQIKLIRNVIFLVLIGTIITGGIVYGIIAYQQKVAKAELFAVTDTFGDDPKTITRTQIVKPTIINSLIITNIISLIVISILMLYYSHRMAGPVYRIKMSMERVGEGHFENDVDLRIKDEFQGLADSFNKMLKGLRFNIMRVKVVQNDIHATLVSLIEEKAVSENKCTELEQQIEKCRGVLSTFMVSPEGS